MEGRRRLLAFLALAAALGNAGSATAQDYPSRPITMIVPYAAGGPGDVLARILIERMQVSLGQPIIIENVAGASGSIGVGRLAHAVADGYTLDFGSLSTHVVNGATYELKYDIVKDFTPVSLIATVPQVIVAKKAAPAKNLKELIAWLAANPDKALQGTTGKGAVSHLAGVLLQKETGTRFQFVPYRGGSLLMQDLLAGQIDLLIDMAVNSLPQVRAGAVNAFAVMAKGRLAAAPDIPTVDEAGLPGLYVLNWYGIWMPKGATEYVIGKVNAAAVAALSDSTLRQRFGELGAEIPSREQQTPEALAAYHKAEIEKWWPIIKAAGLKVE